MVEHVSADERVCRSSNCDDDDDGTRNRIGVRYYYSTLGSWEKVVNSPGATICCMPAFYTWDSFLSIRVAFVLLAGTSRRAWLIWSKEAATEETCSWSSSFNVDGSTTVLHFSPLGRRCRLLMFVSHKFPHSISIEFQCTLRCLQRSWRTIRFIVLWLSLYPQHLKPSYHMVTSHHHHVGGDNEGVVIMHFFRYSGDHTKGHSCYCFFSPTLCILFTNVTLIRGGLNDCLEERPSTH